jgi:hypothetical protein
VQQAAQHQLRLPRTGAARDLGDPLHVDAAAHHTVEHRAAERELPSVADVVVQSLCGDGERRAGAHSTSRTRLLRAREWGLRGEVVKSKWDSAWLRGICGLVERNRASLGCRLLGSYLIAAKTGVIFLIRHLPLPACYLPATSLGWNERVPCICI